LATSKRWYPVFSALFLDNPSWISPAVPNYHKEVEGNRITSLGSRQDGVSAKNARVINGSGNTILPGFMDGHGHYEDFAGKLYLHLGAISCPDIEIFPNDYWSMAQRDGVRMGNPGADDCGPPNGRTFRGNVSFSTPEEGREIVRRKKEIGLDMINVVWPFAIGQYEKYEKFPPDELKKMKVGY
jgi:hypothetical protein